MGAALLTLSIVVASAPKEDEREQRKSRGECFEIEDQFGKKKRLPLGRPRIHLQLLCAIASELVPAAGAPAAAQRTAYPSSAQPANGASRAASNCPGVVDDLIQNRQNKR